MEESEEAFVLPGSGRVFDHGVDGIVELVVVHVEVHVFVPKSVFFANNEQLRNVESLEILFAVFHQFIWLIFGIEDSQFSEDSDVCSFQTHGLFQQVNHFFSNVEFLIVVDQFLQVIGMDHNVHAGHLSKFIFLSSHTSHAEFFPSLGGVCLFGSIYCLGVLLESDEAGGDFSVVFEIDEEDLGSFIELIVEAPVTDSLNISTIVSIDEGFQFSKFV